MDSLTGLPVQLVERLRNKLSVLADKFAIKPDLSAPVVSPLDADHVPVDLRLIAIAGFIVGLPGSEMKRPGNFFIKEIVSPCKIEFKGKEIFSFFKVVPILIIPVKCKPK